MRPAVSTGMRSKIENLRMPVCRPESPRFASGGGGRVWQLLRRQLGDEEVLISGLRFSDRSKDYEVDILLLLPGAGVLIVEVKGGSVWRVDGEWYQSRGDRSARIDPVGQARSARYALRDCVERDSRWY